METKLTGLVLKSVAVTDSKTLLTVLTPDRGKKTIACHGVRKLTSRNMPAVQPFCYSDFVCTEKNGFLTLKESFLKESFFELRCDLYNCALGCYFLELASECATEEGSEEELLSLTLNSLYALCVKKQDRAVVKVAHELRLLATEGCGPGYECCAFCGKPLKAPFCFSPSEGGMVCALCAATLKSKCYPMDGYAKAALEYILTCPTKRLFSFKLSKSSLRLLADASESAVLYTFEHPFESLNFYKKLGEEPENS